MPKYLISVSNHPQAGGHIQTEESSNSWEMVYYGPIASAAKAKAMADEFSREHQHIRLFRSVGRKQDLGKLIYEVHR
jgi:hypothetical protein